MNRKILTYLVSNTLKTACGLARTARVELTLRKLENFTMLEKYHLVRKSHMYVAPMEEIYLELRIKTNCHLPI